MSVHNFIENKSLAIIVLGDFAPSTFQPYWLSKKELIKESEAHNTKVEIIHNELVNFSLSWAKVDVRPDRLEISTTSEPYFSMVRDLMSGIFHFLKETPVKAVGINIVHKLGLKTQERFYEFGNKLAPLSNWDYLNDPRINFIEILEKKRKDEIKGHYRIRVEADFGIDFGVNIVTNNHIDADFNNNSKINEVVRILNDHWKDSFDKADNYVSNIWEKFAL